MAPAGTSTSARSKSSASPSHAPQRPRAIIDNELPGIRDSLGADRQVGLFLFWQTEAGGLGLIHLSRLDEGLWCSVGRVHEVDVLWIAPRRIDGQEYQGRFVEQRDRMDSAFLEKDQLPRLFFEP